MYLYTKISSQHPSHLPKHRCIFTDSEDNEENDSCSTCSSLLETVQKLEQTVKNLQEQLNKQPGGASIITTEPFQGYEAWKKEIEARIEDNTNRQTRKTLVFRNIPQNYETEETWDHTKQVLADEIAVALKIPSDKAIKLIDRCHRGGNVTYYRKNKKCRPIFAEMNRWTDCDHITKKFRSKEVRSFCDFKYGPSTTKRRNIALMKRKEIMQRGEYESAYVAFPAVLMVKKFGQKKYTQIEDYSKIEVNILDKKNYNEE